MNTASLIKLHHQMVALRERAEKAEAELQKLRDREAKQKPVAMVDAGDDGYFAEILPDCSVGVGDMLYAFPPLNVDAVLWQQSFDQWWDAHGQYLRAGGGQYEKTFAYHAWEAAAAFYAAPVAAHATSGLNPKHVGSDFDEFLREDGNYFEVACEVANPPGMTVAVFDAKKVPAGTKVFPQQAAPAASESNRARAARIVALWPKWKRNWRLTRHSPKAAHGELVEAGGCAPAVFIPDDDTRRNDEAFAAIKPGSAAGIMSGMNACMHRDTCRAMLQSAPQQAAPAHKKCAGCNGHGMLGNGHPDCCDVVCHFCVGTGVDSSPAATTTLSDDKLISLIYKHFGTEDHPRIVYESGPLYVTKLTYGMRALADAIIAEASIQQATPSVPEEWLLAVSRLMGFIMHPTLDADESIPEIVEVQRLLNKYGEDLSRALLQSADHSGDITGNEFRTNTNDLEM